MRIVRKLIGQTDDILSRKTAKIATFGFAVFSTCFLLQTQLIQIIPNQINNNLNVIQPPPSIPVNKRLSENVRHKSRPKFQCMWPKHQSRNVSLLTHPDKVTTVIHSHKTCTLLNNTTPFLLVMVQSAVASFEARQNIRDTWARNAEKTNSKIVFLLGQPQQKDKEQEDKLRMEAEDFGDIIQEGFTDSWTNLTIKSLMMLKWFEKNCNIDHHTGHVKYLMKVDEDVYVNLPELNKILLGHSEPSLLMGSLRCDPNPKIIRKTTLFKGYAAKYHNAGEPDCLVCKPGCQRYQPKRPPCLRGGAYVMDAKTAIKMYKASLDVKILGFEDIFVTGIIAKKLKIRPTGNHRFMLVDKKGDTRKAIKSNACGVVAAHLENEELKKIHDSVELQLQKGCNTKKVPRRGAAKCPSKYFH